MSSTQMIAAAHDEYLTAQFASLPPLPAVEKLSNTVWRILGGNPGKFQLQGTNTYLVGTGRERLLIDTAQGVPAWSENLKSVLEQEKATVTKALITHFHHDHVGGIWDLKKLCPGTAVYKKAPNADEREAQEIRNIDDGDAFAVEGATLTAVYTPGHAPDHMCFVLGEENALFTGDNVLGHGSSSFVSLAQYMASLQRMLELKPGRAYPGHGQLIEAGQNRVAEYIRHRQRREAQVVRALLAFGDERGDEGAAATSMELVQRIYVDIDPALHRAAEVGVIQVLEKLEREGVVGSLKRNETSKWHVFAERSIELVL